MAEKIVEVDGKRYMKVQKGKYFNKKKNRKMRRHHPVRWILISAFCLLVVAPVGFVFGAFYVPKATNLPDTYDKFEENLSTAIANSLCNIPEKGGTFELKLNQSFINSGLAYAKHSFIGSSPANNYVDNFYCTIEGNKYNFYVDAHAAFFQTRVGLLTTLDISQTTFTFNINNIILGRLPIKNIATSILPNFIDEQELTKAISGIFRATISLKDMKITYPREYFIEDVGKILKPYNEGQGASTANAIGPFADLILSLYAQIKDDPSFDGGITFKLRFQDLINHLKDDKGNFIELNYPVTTKDITKIPTIPETEYANGFATRKNTVIECLNKGLISPKTSLDGEDHGCDFLFKLLLDGTSSQYKYLSDDVKKIIVKEYVAKAGEEISPDRISEYVGLFKKAENESIVYRNGFCDNLIDELNKSGSKYSDDSCIMNTEDQVNSLLEKIEQGTDVQFGYLGEDLLSDYLRCQIAKNFMYCFPLKINNSYMLPTIYFKDFGINLKKVSYGKTEFDLTLIGKMDIEGFTMPFTVLNNINVENRKIIIKPYSYYLGAFPLNDVGQDLMDFLARSISTKSEDLFSYNASKGFIINFANFTIPKTGEPYDTINEIIKGSDSAKYKVNLVPSIDSTTSEKNIGRLTFSFVKA